MKSTNNNFLSEAAFCQADVERISEDWRNNDGDGTLRMNYPLTPDSIVIDVGGYVGKFAQDIFCRHACHLYIYEPIYRYHEVIRKMFAGNEKVRVYPHGLAHIDGVGDISVIQESSSLYKTGDETERIIFRQASVEIDNILQDQKADKIDLLKINIEGGEYALLEHLIEAGAISKIENLQVQFHIWIKNYEARRDRIRELLSATHELTYDYPFIWENWRLKK